MGTDSTIEINGIEVIIEERGNGFPDEGDYVGGGDGNLYHITKMGSRIHTQSGGRGGNYIHATVELADWSDCAEEEQGPGAVIIP